MTMMVLRDMPTNRTPLSRRSRPFLTAEAVALFRLCRGIIDRGEEEVRHEELRDARVRLHSLLGRRLWEVDVLDAAEPTDGYDASGAHALYRALAALARS
jgi:hypothetical protein